MTIFLALVACSDAPPASASPSSTIPEAVTPGGAPTAIPEVAPAGPGAIPEADSTHHGSVPKGSIQDALDNVPVGISQLYSLSISPDRNQLTFDPPVPKARRDARSAGFSAEDSARGGKIITLDGGPFDRGEWRRATLASLVSSEANRSELTAAGYALDTERDLLVVTGDNDTNTTLFAFSSEAGKLGIVGICSTVTVLDFNKPTAQIAVRKPVIYLYPEQTSDLVVNVELEGEFLVRYPAMDRDGWHVSADPDGLLHTADGREHRYLFWEGVGARFDIHPEDAFCIPGDETATFLEEVCERNALTDTECGDFVTYWLPAMVDNPYNLIAFPDAQYEEYAALSVHPKPDTVIRQFMVFRGVDRPLRVGSPALEQRRRSGFTVVEWGGVELPAFR